jgi:hypothetical protein
MSRSARPLLCSAASKFEGMIVLALPLRWSGRGNFACTERSRKACLAVLIQSSRTIMIATTCVDSTICGQMDWEAE